MNIFLIGYRCTGKTSVGYALSKKLRLTFVDADRRLVEKEGKTIAEMVAGQGWDYFRLREKEVLKSICVLDGQVVATGGGVVLDPENVAAMKRCGRLVWLQAAPETIRRRLLMDDRTTEQRPALTSRGAADEIESTLKERAPYYQAAMDFSIDTDGQSVGDICEIIVKWFDSE
ncbi:MAG: shikimate kinase [Desulfobacterales bacterium]|nr:shikimate kinase [Desulfobacterales bacterium]